MNNHQLNRIEHLLQRLDAAVVVRDPGNARAAEAYDALRKQLNLTVKSHRAHVAHLLSLSDSLERNASIELIRDRVNDFLEELAIKNIASFSPDFIEAFETTEVSEGDQDTYEVLEPATVEMLESGGFSVIRQGKVKKINGPAISENLPAEFNDPEQDEPLQVPTIPKGISRVGVVAITAIALITGLLIGGVFLGADDPDPVKEIEKKTLVEVSTTLNLDSQNSSTTVPSTTIVKEK
jgi:hypothetical protein